MNLIMVNSEMFLVKLRQTLETEILCKCDTCYEPGITRKKWKWNQQQALNY